MPLRGHLLVIGTLPLTFVSQITWLLTLEILKNMRESVSSTKS